MATQFYPHFSFSFSSRRCFQTAASTTSPQTGTAACTSVPSWTTVSLDSSPTGRTSTRATQSSEPNTCPLLVAFVSPPPLW
ncbi:hypothetical protein E2C01_083604 [Portunus trituberculatus]|uniref:Uncharacterized protein n=1 Tax=Portunus trituberculatus TaxID=210409 RepID=A0A5B7J1P9_PORTR|nr:hypothetical protein [Portunus trituberculatus]